MSVTENNSPTKISVPGASLSPAVNTSFTYDGANRLASITDSSYARSLCYDSYGNGWTTAYSGTPGLPGNAPFQNGGACPAGSGPTPYVAGSNKLTGVPYDGDGNQTNFRGNTVNYDAEGRMVSVVSGSTTLVSYQYDGNGRRVRKTTPSGTTNYVYDASGALMAEYLGTALSKEHVRFHSSFIGSNVDLVAYENVASGAPCTTCFVIPDYLGNVRMVADNAGKAVSRHDYLPFGEEASADVNRPAAAGFGLGDGAVQRFTGKERDAESGLDYFGARYYGSALGRWTSPDWSAKPEPVPYVNLEDPQTLNLYSYVRNNPLSKPDADGHCAEDACVIEGAAVSTGVLYGGAALAGALGLPSVQHALNQAGDAILSGAKSLVNSAVGLITQASRTNSNEQNAPPPSSGAPQGNTQTTDTPQSTTNTNPYAGPVSGPVTVVDSKGNAIPVGTGQQVQGSKDGRYVQVKDADGNPTGTRIDGGHKPSTHPDPRARQPHAHVPGATNPEGTPWLPVNQ